MDEQEKQESRRVIQDSFQNLVTLLGTVKDKSRYGRFKAQPLLSSQELDDMYEQSPMHATVVDRIVDDSTRPGFFRIGGADSNFDSSAIMSKLDDLDALDKVRDAARWARLYGGCLLIPMFANQSDLSEPMPDSGLGRITGFQLAESPYAMPDFTSNGALYSMATYGVPETYRLTKIGTGKPIVIHASRCIRFDGVRVSPSRLIENSGWGPSVLERPREALQALGEAMGYAHNILHEISVMVLKMKGMRAMQTGSADDQATLRAIGETFKTSVDTLHVAMLDSEDEYQAMNRSVTGVTDIMDQFKDWAVRDTYHPRSILLGEQPKGMNASGRTEKEVWDDRCAGWQGGLERPLSRLVQWVGAAENIRVPDEFVIDFQPLSMPTEKERAEVDKLKAEADEIRIVSRVESAQEIRERRISDGELVPGEGPLDTGGET